MDKGVFSIGQRKLAFSFLGATMNREKITANVLRDYYTLCGNPVGESTLYSNIKKFEDSNLVNNIGHDNDNLPIIGRPAAVYQATESGLAMFSILYMNGLTTEFAENYIEFRNQIRTDMGRFVIRVITEGKS